MGISSRLMLVLVCCFALVAVAEANGVYGVPVVSTSSTAQAVPTCPTLEGKSCYNPATGTIGFYIPLQSNHGGVFGVTNHSGGTAGTYADTGSGASNSLTMNLMFSPVLMPVTSASLTFSFIDLDLKNVNDPTGFFETVRFYSTSGTPLTPTINTMGQSGGGVLPYTISGNSVWQTIMFPDVTSILQNPFYVQLTFGSCFTSTARHSNGSCSVTGTNTMESLSAVLNYNPYIPPLPPHTPVPEPGTLMLVGSGILSYGFRRLRK